MTMTLIFTDSFSFGSPTAPTPKWTSDDFAGSATGRHGDSNGAWYCAGSGNYPVKGLGVNASILHVGVAIKRTTSNAGTWCRVRDAGTIHIGIGMDDTGRLVWQRNTTTVETGAASVVQVDTWGFLEFRVYIHDSSGRLTVKWNGVQIFDYTGDTRNAANAYVNEFTFQNSSNSAQLHVDDLYIYQCTDFANDPWIGDARVFPLSPNGAGNYAQFTPSAGSNYQNVDEAAQDGDTTYNSTSTPGNIDSFAYANITGTGTVKAVTAVATHRKDDAGTRTIAQLVRAGSTDYAEAGQNTGDSYGIFYRIMELNPADSAAWELSDVNDSEYGYKLVA